MIQRFLVPALAVIILGTAPAAARAQNMAKQAAAGADVRGIMIEDSLPPAKKQLRDLLTVLRDTLNRVSSMDSRISRARASGMTSVVASNARQLEKACVAAVAQVRRTTDKLAGMETRDERGDNALSAYRGGLADLLSDLVTCQHDDSLMLAAPKFDGARAESVSSAAAHAVELHDQIRDALLRMLGVRLPVSGYIPAPRPFKP